jgi:hypothetical protein
MFMDMARETLEGLRDRPQVSRETPVKFGSPNIWRTARIFRVIAII